MANKYVNKLIVGTEVKLDLSGDTIVPGDLKKGVTAHDKSGAPIVGSNEFDVNSQDARGSKLTGTMPDNGAVSKTLDATTGNQEYTVPAGKHSGKGSVKIVLEAKQATPTKSEQEVTPTAGKVLSKVTVEAIPEKYQDVSGVTATAAHVLDGDKFVDAAGTVVTGTMANNGAVSKTMDGLTTTSVTIAAGYTSGGTVSLTDAIETALAAI